MDDGLSKVYMAGSVTKPDHLWICPELFAG